MRSAYLVTVHFKEPGEEERIRSSLLGAHSEEEAIHKMVSVLPEGTVHASKAVPITTTTLRYLADWVDNKDE